MTDKPIARLAVQLSGSGRTLQNLLDRCADRTIPAEIVLVISNKSDAYGLVRAKNAGIETAVMERKAFPNRESFSAAIFDRCRAARADLVCMAGFLQLITIPADFTNRVLNIHPALLPKYGGKGMYGHHVHKAVLANHETESGCTIHFADNIYDHGPIIFQRHVPVLAGDTPDTLADRVFAVECEAYPDAIQRVLDGILR